VAAGKEGQIRDLQAMTARRDLLGAAPTEVNHSILPPLIGRMGENALVVVDAGTAVPVYGLNE
jgi:hypothetical protein